MSGVRIRGLRRTFPLPGGGTLAAVDGIDLDVAPGEILGLLGPNGAGKTTTLRVLATLTTPTEGTAEVGGHDVVRDPEGVRRALGYLSPDAGLPPRLTARESLRLFAALYDVRPAGPAIDRAVRHMGIGDFLDRRVDTLSTGMGQRLRIACATLHAPRVLVLDEPTLGLDAVATRDLLATIQAARDGGAAVVLSTHMVDDAARVCDRVAVIDRGRIRAVGTPAEVVAAAGTADLRDAFLALVAGPGDDA
jgi:ABC-type multidrug transport system ATPase subunit